MRSIKELKDLLDIGEMNETWGFTDGDVCIISTELTARIFREFSQIRDEVDMLQNMLSHPVEQAPAPSTSRMVKLEADYRALEERVLSYLLSSEEQSMDDQRHLEEPYAEQAARQDKVDNLVTESWDNLDSIDIVDSIKSGDLSELLIALRSDEEVCVYDELCNIIDTYMKEQAENEV